MIQKQKGLSVVLNENELVVNGRKYELPKRVQNRSGHSITQVDGKLYIDGYEFRKGEFRRSLSALWHMLF